MSIIHIPNQQEGVAWQMANAMRNAHISKGSGALIVAPLHATHPLKNLLEKIIKGAELWAGIKAEDMPWKPSPLIIFIGDEIKRLADIEKMVPGFTNAFGPVKEIGET